jgi:hypothetical protein
MNEKHKMKEDYDQLYSNGLNKFYDYMQKGKIEEWVKTYMPFMNESVHKAIIEYYNNTHATLQSTQSNICEQTRAIEDTPKGL